MSLRVRPVLRCLAPLTIIAVVAFSFNCLYWSTTAAGGNLEVTTGMVALQSTVRQVDATGLAKFLDMSMFVVDGLPKYARVPGLEALTFYVWDVDPKPIVMLENSHLRWYETPSEKKLISLQRYIMTRRFTPADGIVVDMGINDGYISALAAAHDYGVVGVDGQPECVRRFLFAKAINNWQKVRVYNNIMANEPMSMPIPNGVCGGGSRYVTGDGTEPRILPEKGIVVDMPGKTEVYSKRLDELVTDENVIFFHLDVEGAEISVLRSASSALSERRIKNLVWEFAPHRWSATREQTLSEVKSIMADFICRDMRDVDDRKPYDSQGIITDWNKKYAETEERKGIVDIWCTLQV